MASYNAYTPFLSRGQHFPENTKTYSSALYGPSSQSHIFRNAVSCGRHKGLLQRQLSHIFQWYHLAFAVSHQSWLAAAVPGECGRAPSTWPIRFTPTMKICHSTNSFSWPLRTSLHGQLPPGLASPPAPQPRYSTSFAKNTQ